MPFTEQSATPTEDPIEQITSTALTGKRGAQLEAVFDVLADQEPAAPLIKVWSKKAPARNARA